MKRLALTFIFTPAVLLIGSWVSSVGIVTWYGLDRPGFKPLWKQFFFTSLQPSPKAYPASCTLGTGFPSWWVNWIVASMTHHCLVPTCGPSWHGMRRTLPITVLHFVLLIISNVNCVPDFECECHCSCKPVCFLHHDLTKWRSRRNDEKDREGGGTVGIWWSR